MVTHVRFRHFISQELGEWYHTFVYMGLGKLGQITSENNRHSIAQERSLYNLNRKALQIELGGCGAARHEP